jgi:hypothetical protein
MLTRRAGNAAAKCACAATFGCAQGAESRHPTQTLRRIGVRSIEIFAPAPTMIAGMPDGDRVPNRRTDLIISWPAAALGALIVAIAALTALAILVNESKVLATLAIVLAIVAFVVQIIVFIVQAQTASSQSVRAQTLHGQLQAILGQIQERTEGTQESLVGISEKLLEAALGRSLPAAQKASEGDKDVFVRDLAAATIQNLREREPSAQAPPAAHQERRRRLQSPPQPVWPGRTVTDEDRRASAESSTWPSKDQAEPALATVVELDQDDIMRLARFVEDDNEQLEDIEPSDEIAIPGYSATERDRPLIDAGLLAPSGYMSPSVQKEIYGLAPLGRMVARLMTSPDPIPPELQGDARLIRLRNAVPMIEAD